MFYIEISTCDGTSVFIRSFGKEIAFWTVNLACRAHDLCYRPEPTDSVMPPGKNPHGV